MVSVVVFPVDEPLPKITEVECLVTQDSDNPGEEKHHFPFRRFFRTPRSMIIAFAIGPVESTYPPSGLYLAFSLSRDDSSTNVSVRESTGGRAKRQWEGTLVGYRAREDEDRDLTQFMDVSPQDIAKFVEYLKSDGEPRAIVRWQSAPGSIGEALLAMMAESLASGAQAEDSERPAARQHDEGPVNDATTAPAAPVPQPAQLSRDDLDKIAADVRIAINETLALERTTTRAIIAEETKNALLFALTVAFGAYVAWCLLVLPLAALTSTIFQGICAVLVLIYEAFRSSILAIGQMCWAACISLFTDRT
ncbi:hypothetical protein BN946_scf184652.g18 [Trametes cinnabarina]|uniref:Uncharacterized protein n=1 Tax=Pycnoporus cinnabarinus TaxID=5643 RepID=A0A060S3C2_PYCCI|nr:hypothetical protein BN946_scf184652.g18 [Trametes cinnabarina]